MAGPLAFDTVPSAAAQAVQPPGRPFRQSDPLQILARASQCASGYTYAGPCVPDQQGPDDGPGQKDLSFLTVDNTSSTTEKRITWGWDDTAWTGANTGDACALFTTDDDQFANFSLCITVTQAGNFQSKRLYQCDNDQHDRCSGSLVPTFTSTGTASRQTGADPFGTAGRGNNACDLNANCRTDDTVADVTVRLADFGGTGVLLDVCSYPSQQPNSDPSDCVVTPDSQTEKGPIQVTKLSTDTSLPLVATFLIELPPETG